MKIIKNVVEIGNGAAVYVPREYKGKQVLVVLPEKVEDIKKRVLTKLVEFMPNVLGVYLYGSYAREEAAIESDIDLLVIVREKDEKISGLFNDIDIRVLTLENIKNSIMNFPIPITIMLQESIVFLNPLLLEELKKEKHNPRGLRWHFEDIKGMIKIIMKFIKLDDENIDASNVYSLIMRARVLYMIECFLKNRSFSNDGIKRKILHYGLEEKLFDYHYQIYQKIKNNEEVKEKINKNEIKKLIIIIKIYLKEIENETKKKLKNK